MRLDVKKLNALTDTILSINTILNYATGCHIGYLLLPNRFKVFQLIDFLLLCILDTIEKLDNILLLHCRNWQNNWVHENQPIS